MAKNQLALRETACEGVRERQGPGFQLVQQVADPGKLVQVDTRSLHGDDLDALRRFGAFPHGKHNV